MPHPLYDILDKRLFSDGKEWLLHKLPKLDSELTTEEQEEIVTTWVKTLQREYFDTILTVIA
jgi:hypothetical protein